MFETALGTFVIFLKRQFGELETKRLIKGQDSFINIEHMLIEYESWIDNKKSKEQNFLKY